MKSVIKIGLLVTAIGAHALYGQSNSASDSPASIVATDIAAQNAGDWDAYLNLRTEIPGAPENTSNYRILWQQGRSGIRDNVISAQLESMIPIPFDFAQSLIGPGCYIDNLQNPQAFYVIVDYKLRAEDKYACDGPNARLYILSQEDAGWKIVQVSEPPIKALVTNGFGIGSAAEQEILDRQELRVKTGRFLNSRGQVVFSIGPIPEAVHQFPTSITVAHFTSFNSSPSCQYQSLLGCVDFITYVKNVLPNEWGPPSSFATQALEAGAITVKMVGWYRVYNAKYPNQGFDVSDQDCDQVYRPNSAVTITNNAVDAVAGVGFERASTGTLFYPSYSAGSYNNSGYHDGQMYQNGSNYLANNGYSYTNAYMDIVHYYYDDSSTTGGQLVDFFTYTESGTGCSGTANLSAPTLSAPSNGSTGQSTTPTFSWSNVSGATFYRLIVATNPADLPTSATDSGPTEGQASVVINRTITTGTTLISPVTLNAGTTYYWEVHGGNSTQYGDWSSQWSFATTGGCIAPTATTNAATGVSTTGATFNGYVNPNGCSTTLYFQYGTTVSYGSKTPTGNVGTTAQSVSYSEGPFSPGTTYHYQIVANNSGGTTYGNDAMFTTQSSNYTISTSSSPSNGGTTSGGGTFASGSSVTVTATANNGYTFSNWTENGNVVSSSASYTFTLNGSRNLVANFTSNPLNYTVTTSSSPTSGGTTSGGGTFPSGSSVTITSTPNSGYVFTNWTQSGTVVSTSASYTFTVTASRNYVANFTAVNYSVTTSSSPSNGGTTSGGGTFPSGSSVTVTAAANSGYIFSNWTENGSVVSTSASYTFTLSGSRNLVANFATVNYTIATSSSPSNGGTTSGGGTFAAGTSHTVTATANSGYTFSNWTESGSVVSTSSSYTFTLNSSRTLVANFATTNYTITTSSLPSNGGTTSGGGTFAAGTSHTVTATANSGYSFSNWTENGGVVSTSASYTFTLTSSRNLVANFTTVNYTITTSSSPSNGGTTSGGGTFAAGTSHTVTATANSGFTFSNWTESGSVVSTSASYTFTLTGNRNLVANFTAVNYTITTSSSPSNGGTTSGGGTFAAGTSHTVIATANSGYTFSNWTESGSIVSTSSNYTFTLTGSRTLVANFTVITVNYTIATSSLPSNGGTTSGSGTFAAGTSHTVTATANSGFTFSNWNENGSVVSTSASYTFALNSNRSLVANFSTVSPPTVFAEHLDFNDNQVPPGWSIVFPNGPGTSASVSNERFEIGQIDTYAALDKPKTLPPGATAVHIQYRCDVQDIFYGMGYQIHLLMQDGSDFAAGIGKVGASDQMNVFAGDKQSPAFNQNYSPDYGTYVLDAVFRDGQIIVTTTKEGSSTPLVSQTVSVPGLVIHNLQKLRLFGDMTTGGPAWIDDADISLEPATQLGNISTRGSVQTGDNVMIGGFIITGTQPKKVIVRAIGPSLTQYGVPGALADPTLELHDSSGALIANNNNWKDSQQVDIQASGLAPSNDLESAIIMTLNPGAYTAIVRGINNTTGVALVETYDLDPTIDSKLTNISTRGLVQTGDNVMIGGTIITGADPGKVIIRAIGPSLAQYGIIDSLQDPTLELHDGNGALIAFDDNWKDSQQTDIQATGLAPGSDAESAILATLSPGSYTAIVRGKNNTSGVGLVEAYKLGN